MSSNLINIATGTIISSDVNVDSSIDIEKGILQKVVNKSLSEITLKKKDQARTFAIMRKTVKVDGKEINLSLEQLSQKLLASAARDNCLMEDVFSYELASVAPALFLNNAMMRKTNNTELMNALLVLCPCIIKTYSADSYNAIHGCTWFYCISWPKVGNLNDLYRLFLDSLLLDQGGATVIFDDYTQESTKAPGQKRRKNNISSTQTDLKMNTIIQTDRKKFLSCKENKQKLIDLFSFDLLREYVLLKHALDDGDANTMIVQQALNEATKKNVVVYCIDTDVFIALLNHFDISGNSIVMTTKQGLCSNEKVAPTLDNDLRQCLLISHAISGCDTVSSTFGMGKWKAFNKFKVSPYWRSAIKTLRDNDIEIDRMVELREKLYINLYGKVATNTKSLDQVREIMFNLPKYTPIT